MSLIELPHGIHASIAADLYHERVLGIVNKGALDQLAKTPAHYRAWLTEPAQEETPALAFGKALHARVMETELFASTYIAEQRHPFRRVTEAQRNAKKPSEETLRAIEYWDAWAASAAGKIELGADDAAKIEAMREAVMAHPIASKLFVGGMPEATCLWQDSRHGLLCKSRMDYWRADINVIADLKSTDDASPFGFARSCASYRYPVQSAHYVDGIVRSGLDRPAFLFVAVEKSAPHAVAVYQLDADAQARGEDLRDRAMDTLNECLANDAWPSYPVGVTSLSLPAWAFKDAA